MAWWGGGVRQARNRSKFLVLFSIWPTKSPSLDWGCLMDVHLGGTISQFCSRELR